MTNTKEFTADDIIDIKIELNEKNKVDYATDLFYNDDEKILEAFVKAVKDTYNIDSVVYKNFVFMQAEDVYEESEFDKLHESKWSEILMISSEVTDIIRDNELKDANIIQRVFDEERRKYRLLNDVDELIEIEYCIESDEFSISEKNSDIFHHYDLEDINSIASYAKSKLIDARYEMNNAENKIDILFQVDAKSLLEAIRTNELNETQVEECKSIIESHTIDAKHRNTFSERFAKLDKQHQSDLHELILAMRNL